MRWIRAWRVGRERKHRAKQYLHRFRTASEAIDFAWLTALTGDRAVAEREVTFARRALGVIVAERDALDDRTASDVARALSQVIDAEAERSAQLASLWSARRKAYSVAMTIRGHPEGPTIRLARVLLEGASVVNPTAEALATAGQFVQSTRTHANEALRAVFGEASLPDDIRPSAIRP